VLGGRDTGQQGHGTVGTWDGGDAMAGCAVAGMRDSGDTGQQAHAMAGTWDSRDAMAGMRWRGRDGGVRGGRDA